MSKKTEGLLEHQKISSYEKLNSFLVNDLSQLKGADSSLE